MTNETLDVSRRFIVLQSIEHGSKFYSTNTRGGDPRKLATGELAYRVIGYADTDEQAQKIVFG
jgi:hypothetical protein